jgi:hemoglobin
MGLPMCSANGNNVGHIGILGEAMSLYSRLGGEPGVAIVVADFYRRIESDDLLGAWFETANGAGIRFHLNAYLAVVLGGPEAYSGRSLRRAHAGLRITGKAWDAVLERLADALRTAGVDEPLIAEVIALVATLRAVVVAVPAD